MNDLNIKELRDILEELRHINSNEFKGDPYSNYKYKSLEKLRNYYHKVYMSIRTKSIEDLNKISEYDLEELDDLLSKEIGFIERKMKVEEKKNKNFIMSKNEI